MRERAFTADAREAKGLHDGSITLVVRAVDPQPEGDPCEVSWNTCIEEWVPWGYISGSRHGRARCGPSLACPFGLVGDRLYAVCEPTEPCEHRGCLSHVTHVCEGCGRGHAGILLDVTDVRVMQAKAVSEEDAKVTGLLPLYGHGSDQPSFARAIRKLYGGDTWLWLGSVRGETKGD